MVRGPSRGAGARVATAALSGMVVGYNPLSMRQAGRWTDVHKVLRGAALIALQGTRQPQKDQPCVTFCESGRKVFDFGYATNKHTGCALSFRTDLFADRSYKAVDWPPRKLQGRGGVVRTKTDYMDVTWIVAYFPLAPAYQLYESLAEWINWGHQSHSQKVHAGYLYRCKCQVGCPQD